MNTVNPACPPIPSLDELLHSGNFIEVNVNHLIPEELVIIQNGEDLNCVQIIANSPSQNGDIRYSNYDSNGTTVTSQISKNYLIEIGRRFHRKNPRKEYDDITKKMGVRIRNYPETQNLTLGETIFTNKGLSDIIGSYLGPPTSGKGGRRKRAGTKRRTRKNKRKSTRRIRRKYKI
jgi:hypothetical protein